jgi:MoaA/NifB/PqqE/SkfB family radical SAM enzyme
MSPVSAKNTDMAEGLICLQPFYLFEVTTSGRVYTCCPSWTKLLIGNIRKKTVREIWNSRNARYLRKKLYRGEWRDVCNPICPQLALYRSSQRVIPYAGLDSVDVLTPQLVEEIRAGRDYLESSPTVFTLSNSKVCNLACIMCDRLTQKDNPRVIARTAEEIPAHLGTAKKLLLTGMGEPLARPDSLGILTGFENRNPDLRFEVITNALLLPDYWERIKHQRFGSLLISTDAASKKTYERIRRGGKWEDFLKSLALVKEHKERFSAVTLNMTVMRGNYREIPLFIDFAESYGFHVSFQRIRGRHGDQNFFTAGDEEILMDLKGIIQNEHMKQRMATVFWGDLVEFAAHEMPLPPLAEYDQTKNIVKRFRMFLQRVSGERG